jgi:SAM-dependent methyltransferase
MINQISYWNKVANEKIFTHPINISLLENLIDKNACIIDYGCGYGRLVDILNKEKFTDVQGFDISIELINRGNRNGVENIFQIDLPYGLPVENNSVDCFLLFAVLTCIPENELQMELFKTLLSKLKKGGIIYISDYYLQTQSMEVEHYEYLNNNKENFGVFNLAEGATFRHHTQEWIKHLLKDFQIVNANMIEVKTMNGNKAEAFQIIAQKV